MRVACDLPSGVESDSGDLLNDVPVFDLTAASMRLWDSVGVDATKDYFLWQELQVEENLSNLSFDAAKPSASIVSADKETSEFIHNEIRDKIRDVGIWLGFRGDIEVKVSEGSKVDAVWEASIGNMGRVIYVFEVQTKGSIDSLLLNLLKSLKNPAVQGVVAVSDKHQIEKIKKHSHDLEGLATKIKYWDYEDVIRAHECLETVNESINKLGLVPDSFKK